jgi:hypothetical protein
MCKQKIIQLLTKKSILVSGILLILTIFLIIRVSSMDEGENLSNVLPSTWRGISPGKTDKQEMINILGQPDEIWACEPVEKMNISALVNCIFGPRIYLYKDAQLPNGLTPTHKIRFRSGTVWVVIEDQVGYPKMSVEEFVERHGLPEKVTWSRLTPSQRAILFCDQGMIVQGGEYVAEIYYFQPLPLDQCLYEFRSVVATEDPFPDSDYIGPENPYSFGESQAR